MHHEVFLVENALTKIPGVKPLYFRVPYGQYNQMGKLKVGKTDKASRTVILTLFLS